MIREVQTNLIDPYCLIVSNKNPVKLGDFKSASKKLLEWHWKYPWPPACNLFLRLRCGCLIFDRCVGGNTRTVRGCPAPNVPKLLYFEWSSPWYVRWGLLDSMYVSLLSSSSSCNMWHTCCRMLPVIKEIWPQHFWKEKVQQKTTHFFSAHQTAKEIRSWRLSVSQALAGPAFTNASAHNSYAVGIR